MFSKTLICSICCGTYWRRTHRRLWPSEAVMLLSIVMSSVLVPSGSQSTDDTVSLSIEEYKAMGKKMQRESMGMPDPKVGERLAHMKPDENLNPEEMGTYMEGDMLVPMTSEDDNEPLKLINDADIKFRWPEGVIYYVVNGDFNKQQRAMIQEAIGQFHQHTCVRFQPYTGTQKDHLVIESKNTGCWSTLGHIGGKQYLNLQAPGCFYQVGVVVHELMHTLGLFHEQSRSDRDDFIDIDWSNIEKGKEHNFKQHKYYGLGSQYDYGSVLHYSLTAFSKNRRPTMVPKLRQNENIGQRRGFSKVDIEKLNLLYNCPPKAIKPSNKTVFRPNEIDVSSVKKWSALELTNLKNVVKSFFSGKGKPGYDVSSAGRTNDNIDGGEEGTVSSETYWERRNRLRQT